MGLHPVFRRCINPRLPTVARLFEMGNNLVRQVNVDALFQLGGSLAVTWLEHLLSNLCAKNLGKHLAGWACSGNLLSRPLWVLIVDQPRV